MRLRVPSFRQHVLGGLRDAQSRANATKVSLGHAVAGACAERSWRRRRNRTGGACRGSVALCRVPTLLAWHYPLGRA